MGALGTNAFMRSFFDMKSLFFVVVTFLLF